MPPPVESSHASQPEPLRTTRNLRSERSEDLPPVSGAASVILRGYEKPPDASRPDATSSTRARSLVSHSSRAGASGRNATGSGVFGRGRTSGRATPRPTRRRWIAPSAVPTTICAPSGLRAPRMFEGSRNANSAVVRPVLVSQRLARFSREEVTSSSEPSREKDRSKVNPSREENGSDVSRPLARSRSSEVFSPTCSSRPSGENSQALTQPPSASIRGPDIAPVAVSHSRIPACGSRIARWRPSGEKRANIREFFRAGARSTVIGSIVGMHSGSDQRRTSSPAVMLSCRPSALKSKSELAPATNEWTSRSSPVKASHSQNFATPGE
jgi:hypothetical protein